VVQRAAAGLSAYLVGHGHRGGAVVIAHDARHNSATFAEDTAHIVAGAGLRAVLLPGPTPTPVAAFAIRHLGAVAGVVVTASHNPARDNGYKVYLGDGSQIVPPADAEIAASIGAVGPLTSVSRSAEVQIAGVEVERAYRISIHRLFGEVGSATARQRADLRLVYTPLHGVGGELVTDLAEEVGFARFDVVPEQALPDPEFPTVDFPNPEEPGALDLALDLALGTDADLVLANDPDADRCAAAIPEPDGARLLTGDEVGTLLGRHLLRTRPDGVYAASIVSGTALRDLCERAGAPYVSTLTGFKWIGRVPGLAFGYEEALGYCLDPSVVADKDGMSALLVLADLAAAAKAAGRTLLDDLDDVACEVGVHETAQVSVRSADAEAIRAVVERLRTSPPRRLGGQELKGLDDLAAPDGDLPPTDGVRLRLAGRARVVVRPSGTEPKIKAYLEVVGPVSRRDQLGVTRRRAHERMAALRADVAALLEV